MLDAKTIVFSQSLLGTALHLVLNGSPAQGDKSAIKAKESNKLLILPRQFFSEQKGGNLILALSYKEKEDANFQSIL